jgi:hypothetical protein
MVLVSINSEGNFYEINLRCRAAEVNLTGNLYAKRYSHGKTLSIFVLLLEGILILLKRRMFSKINKGAV